LQIIWQLGEVPRDDGLEHAPGSQAAQGQPEEVRRSPLVSPPFAVVLLLACNLRHGD
jgi:hypothetical protein